VVGLELVVQAPFHGIDQAADLPNCLPAPVHAASFCNGTDPLDLNEGPPHVGPMRIAASMESLQTTCWPCAQGDTYATCCSR